MTFTFLFRLCTAIKDIYIFVLYVYSYKMICTLFFLRLCTTVKYVYISIPFVNRYKRKVTYLFRLCIAVKGHLLLNSVCVQL